MAFVGSDCVCPSSTSTIEDEEKLKRFRTFVNSDAADDSLVFVRERGQRLPAAASQ